MDMTGAVLALAWLVTSPGEAAWTGPYEGLGAPAQMMMPTNVAARLYQWQASSQYACQAEAPPRAPREGMVERQERGGMSEAENRELNRRIELFWDRREQIEAAQDEDNGARQEVLLRAHLVDFEEVFGVYAPGYDERVIELAEFLDEQGRDDEATTLLGDTLRMLEALPHRNENTHDIKEARDAMIEERREEEESRRAVQSILERTGRPMQ